MKTLASGIDDHLDLNVLSLAMIMRVTRQDGVIVRLTSHDSDIEYDSYTYSAEPGLAPTEYDVTVGMQDNKIQVSGLLDQQYINAADIHAELYHNARIFLAMINWEDPTDGVIQLPAARVKNAQHDDLMWSFEVVGLTSLLNQRWSLICQPTCRAILGDTKCGIDLDTGTGYGSQAFKANGTVTGLTTDRLVFTCGQNFTPEDGSGTYLLDITSDEIRCAGHLEGEGETRSSLVLGTGSDWKTEGAFVGMVVDVSGSSDSRNNGLWEVAGFSKYDGVDDARMWLSSYEDDNEKMYAVAPAVTDTITVQDSNETQYTPSGWFDHGYLTWTSGNNEALTCEIKEWENSTGTITLFRKSHYEISVGDGFTMYAGCDKRRNTCLKKFSNLNNFRGEPDLPGETKIRDYPDQKPIEVDI